MMNQINNLIVDSGVCTSGWSKLYILIDCTLRWVFYFNFTLVVVILHGCPLISTKNLTSSERAWNQLNLAFRIISSMTSEICRLIIERGKWVNDDCLWLTDDGVVSRAVGYWGKGVWIHVFTRLKLFEALSLSFKFVDEKFWTLLSIWLIYSI